MQQTMRMSSFCNSTFLFTPRHSGIGIYHTHNQKSTTALFLSFPFNRTLLSSSFHPLSQPIHFAALSVFPTINSNRLRASAFKKGRKGGSTVSEMDFSDDDDDEDEDEFFDSDNEFDAGDEDDEEVMFLPLGKMKKWLENKPRGFGGRKVYDTSIEDKLLEEIEQSKQAQIINVNNLKNNPVKSGSKKNDQQDKKAAEGVPRGIRVRVANLPKKKNIHRDLKAAFNGVSGIINICPAVSGNKKTKDPVCKGFAFVDFRRELDATRFVQNFSGHNLTFGRVQKQIKCEMMNSLLRNPAGEELYDNDSMTPEVAVSGLVDSPSANFNMNNSSSDLSLESVYSPNADFGMNNTSLDLSLESVLVEFNDQDEEFDVVELGAGRDNLNATSESEATSGDDMEPKAKHAADSMSTRLDRIRALEKKLLAKGKQQRVPKEQKGQKIEGIGSIEKKVLVEFNDQDDEFDIVEIEGRDNLNAISESEASSGDDIEPKFKHASDSMSTRLDRIRALEKKLLARGKQQRVPKEQKGQKIERIRSTEKKVLAKVNQQKVPKDQKVQKLDIPGSAKRLKIKEKALLTGVFSKYGSKTPSTSKEES